MYQYRPFIHVYCWYCCCRWFIYCS